MAAAAAAGATPTPDAHDRALAHRLAAKVVELQKVTSASKGSDDKITNSLKGCKGLAKTPGESFAVVFAMLPVLLIDAVNQLRPLLLDVRGTVAAMHPHASLFRRWLAGERADIDQILAFDNHGKKIDYCAAAKVMLAKNPTDAQVQAVLGVPLSRIKALFSATSSNGSATVTKLNPQMRTFLIAAGVRRSVAIELTK
jgi:hypothetical protein